MNPFRHLLFILHQRRAGSVDIGDDTLIGPDVRRNIRTARKLKKLAWRFKQSEWASIANTFSQWNTYVI